MSGKVLWNMHTKKTTVQVSFEQNMTQYCVDLGNKIKIHNNSHMIHMDLAQATTLSSVIKGLTSLLFQGVRWGRRRMRDPSTYKIHQHPGGIH